MNRRNLGFTLLEIMIALFIFVLVMGMIVTGFNVVMRAKTELNAKSKQLAQIQLALLVLEQDMTQIIDRPVRQGSQRLPAMLVKNSSGDLLEFTRTGWVNPMEMLPRSSLSRVAYHLEQGTLYRKVWPVLDRTEGSEAARRQLLDNVRLVQFSFLNRQGEFVDNLGAKLPRAVRLRIDLTNDIHLERLWLVLGGRS